MNEELLSFLLKEIKSKKQINSLDNSFIYSRLHQFLLTNGNKRKKIESIVSEKGYEKLSKNKFIKEIIKTIREEIGILYGSYLTSQFTKKEKYLKENNFEQLLKCHKSTRERTEFYGEIYSKIFSWYSPKKIADLACGLNPLSFEQIKNKLNYSPTYFCSDLNPSDMNFLQNFFKLENINGVAKAYDITTLEILEDESYKECDLVFLFKALDSFEKIKKNISKEIILKTNAKHIVVSFPTKSLKSKSNFKKERRAWFYNFLEKENMKYEEFEVENEMFFLIKKNDQ